MTCDLIATNSSLFHTLLVGSLSYLALILFLRLSGKRTLSKWNAFDFVVTVAFGSVLATTLISTEVTLAQGVLGLGLLIVWQFFLTWLSVRSGSVQQWIKGHPTLLLWNGEFKKTAMLKERVTEGEIRAAIRSKGGGALEKVTAVVLETDGTFSVLMKSNEDDCYSALSDVQGF